MSATPDLLPSAHDLSTQRVKYMYGGADPCAAVEGCLLSGWRRLLAFDGSTANIGTSPMHVGYVGDLSGAFKIDLCPFVLDRLTDDRSGNPPPGVFVSASEEDAKQMVSNFVYEFSSCVRNP
jgi:hypothetical protein